MKTKIKSDVTIKEGSTLLTAKPFAFVLKSKLRTERCDNCFARKKLLKCSGCQYVLYCDRDCQKESWADHKSECSNLKRVAPRVVPDAARLMAKMIFKLKRGGDQEKGFYTKNSFRKYRDLMSHYSDIKLDQQRMEHFTSLCAVLIEYIGEDMLPNSAELMGIYGRMCVNGFNILDPEMQSIGTGIYLAPSIIDHSCEPNALAVFHGTTIHIRALKAMPMLDWSKVFITYIDLLNPAKERQAELLSTYYFLCQCSCCLEKVEHQLLACPKPDCCAPIAFTQQLDEIESSLQACPECGEHIKAETVKAYKEVSEFTELQLQAMKHTAYVDVCRVCLKKQQGLFHPLDIQRVKILDLAFESSIEMSQWEQAKDLGQELIPGFRKYYGSIHPLVGILYMKVGKINLYLQSYDTALSHLREAERVIRITHGPDHELYRAELLPLLHQCQAEQSGTSGMLAEN